MTDIDWATVLTVLLGLALMPAWHFLLRPLYSDLFLSGELKRYCSGYWRATEPDIRKEADNAKAQWDASRDQLDAQARAAIAAMDRMQHAERAAPPQPKLHYSITASQAEARIEELKATYQAWHGVGPTFLGGLINEGMLLQEIVDKQRHRRELIESLTDLRRGY